MGRMWHSQCAHQKKNYPFLANKYNAYTHTRILLLTRLFPIVFHHPIPKLIYCYIFRIPKDDSISRSLYRDRKINIDDFIDIYSLFVAPSNASSNSNCQPRRPPTIVEAQGGMMAELNWGIKPAYITSTWMTIKLWTLLIIIGLPV